MSVIPETPQWKEGAPCPLDTDGDGNQKRGLISACTCGCRMDIEITQKGAEYIADMLRVDVRHIAYTGR